MLARLSAARPIALLLLPFAAILGGRMATHSTLAADNPQTAGLLFMWLAADALGLALIAKAPEYRPEARKLLGMICAGFVIALIASAPPVRSALLAMPNLLLAGALTVAAFGLWSLRDVWRLKRSGAALPELAALVLPAQAVRFAAKELAMVRLALFSWGRAPDIPLGMQGFAYHRHINPLVGAFLVLQAIEIVVVDLVVSHFSAAAAWVLLALGLWGMLFLIALMRGFRLYPVLLGEKELRIRGGMLLDVSVPLANIAAIEAPLSHDELKRKDVLNGAILAHPNIVLRLISPLTHKDWLGRDRQVMQLAFRLDEPAPFLSLLQARIG